MGLEGYTQCYNLIYDAPGSVNPNNQVGGPYVVMARWTDPGTGGWSARDPSLYHQYNQPLGSVVPWEAPPSRAEPAICHGKPTFVGTRILVTDVLEQVATGMAWEAIVDDWRGDVSKEAIAEAVRFAPEALGREFIVQ